MGDLYICRKRERMISMRRIKPGNGRRKKKNWPGEWSRKGNEKKRIQSIIEYLIRLISPHENSVSLNKKRKIYTYIYTSVYEMTEKNK